uniref:ribonuclease T2 n=1 Tax=Lenzites betulinus TaxID=5632 RepID=A9CQZ0_9APHY|nr:ribonuclease T2 [Lenzites betulinus]BAG12851.1 ribonuclease T2 [Lenzites betulinus]
MATSTTLAVIIAIAGLASATPNSQVAIDLSRAFNSMCSLNGPASCQNSTPTADLCCFEAPGGLIMQTQFWDADPPRGPSDSWTIHGLWPNNCDGTFAENCDPSRDYTDIAGLLTDQGAEDTLDFMQTYWVDFEGKNEEFWEHEWKTHGTCYSTLDPSCLPSDSPTGAEAVAFFETVVKLFKTLPTYDLLTDAGISPTEEKTFTLKELTDALSAATGVTPALNCDGKKLNAIEWYFNLKGSVIDGEFIPIDAISKGSCRESGIEYLPKTGDDFTTTYTDSSCLAALHGRSRDLVDARQ